LRDRERPISLMPDVNLPINLREYSLLQELERETRLCNSPDFCALFS
jgi:hypothetical protein